MNVVGSTDFPLMTTANAVIVSGQALPASRGNHGVVHAIFDYLQPYLVISL